MAAGVGQGEVGVGLLVFAVEQDVEVEGARRVAEAALAALGLFDLLQAFQ